jgi:hypothetical protein
VTGEQDSGSGSGGTPPPQGPPQYGPPSYGTGPYGASPYGASPYGGAPGFGTPGYAAPGFGAPGMLASSADRDRAMDMLNAAYGEGRLTKDEFDIRCSRVLAARHYGDLAPIVADLPGGAFTAPVPYQQDYYPAAMRPPLNGLAVGSLVSSIVGVVFLPPATIAGVVMGHAARRQIRRTGHRGDGVAISGLVVGYIGLAFWALILIILIAVAAHG